MGGYSLPFRFDAQRLGIIPPAPSPVGRLFAPRTAINGVPPPGNENPPAPRALSNPLRRKNHATGRAFQLHGFNSDDFDPAHVAATIATIPARIASGSPGHASTTAASCGSIADSEADLVPYLVFLVSAGSISACEFDSCESRALGSSPSTPVERPKSSNEIRIPLVLSIGGDRCLASLAGRD